MLGANPCVVAVEFQCFVSNQANIFRSKSTIFGNPVILKPSRISKVFKHPGTQQFTGLGILRAVFLSQFLFVV